MKRFVYSLILVTFILAIIPLDIVKADDPSYIFGVTNSGPTAETVYTDPGETVDYVYDESRTNNGGIGNSNTAFFRVHNSTATSQVFTIYYYFWIELSWTSNNTLSHQVILDLQVDLDNGTIIQTGEAKLVQDCEPNKCEGPGSGFLLMTGVMETPSIAGHADMTRYFRLQQIGVAGGGTSAGVVIKHAEGRLSLVPINEDCDSTFEQQEVFENNATIIPTVETPVGPPTDYQLVSEGFTAQDTLRVQTDGGPWNDGTDDRYDAAYSFDGVEWHPLEELAGDALCVVIDPEHPELMTIIFTYGGETGDFYIRSDDTAGAFADNTQVMPFVWSLASVVNTTAISCTEQFSYDSEEDLLTSGTVAATAPSTTVTTALVPGEWYLLIGSGGPWHDNEEGEDIPRYDMAAQNSDGTWGEISGGDWTAANCVPEILGNYANVYFQADQAELALSVNDVHDNLMISDGHWENNTGSLAYSIYAVAYNRFPSTCESLFDVDSADLILSGRIDANLPNGIEIQIPYDKSDQKPTDAGKDYGGTQLPVRYYMIEISGGPWYDGQLPKWEVQISANNGTTWTDLKDFGESIIHPNCVVKTDNYHYRVMFASDGTVSYRLRVDDDAENFVDNTGFVLYEWSMINTSRMEQAGAPEPGACDVRYSHETEPTGSITFLASSSSGVYVPGIAAVPLAIAIETVGGPWLNNGIGESQYDVALSDDNGVTWHLIWEYIGEQCYQQSGDESHVLVYLNAIAGKQYKVRVFDEDGNFAANTGSMGINVYTQAANTMDQWTNCGDNYYGLKPISTSDSNKLKTSNVLLDLLLMMVGFTDPVSEALAAAGALIDTAQHVSGIPSNLANGVLVNGQILTGQQYAIQIYGGPWYPDASDDTPHFDVELSDNNGVTWYDDPSLLPGMQCLLTVTPHNEEGYIRLYFYAQPGAVYRIRVADSTSYMDDHGSMDYALFQVTQQDVTLYTPGQVDDWAEACTAPPTPPAPPAAPSSVFDVVGWLGYIGGLVANIPDWIVYSISSLKFFFLFCPEHLAALQMVPQIFADREPFATVLSIIDLVQKLKASYEALKWDNEFAPPDVFNQGEGGGVENENQVSLLEPITDPNSALNNGPLFHSIEGGGAAPISSAYLAACQGSVNPILGSRFGFGVCYSFAYIRAQPNVLYWMELGWEIMWLILFVSYIAYRVGSIRDLISTA